MDSFFVEVERLDDPALRGKPVAVGGTGRRGVIASASYEARAWGVRSAQPTAEALSRCGSLVVLPPRHQQYSDMSVQVFEVFRSFTPKVEGLSLDEAFLDVSGLRHHFDSPVSVGAQIRATLRGRLGLPSSVGVARTKFMAKLASEAAKPDGLLHVPTAGELEFLHPLPVRSLWGVGPAAAAALQRLGLTTVGDLAEVPERTLAQSLGPSQAAHLHALAHARDSRPVEPDSEARSISVEETFGEDITDREVLASILLAQAQKLSDRLRRAGLAAGTVTVKLRTSDFDTSTRSASLKSPVDSPRDVFNMAKELLGAFDGEEPVRLLGLGAGSLVGSDAPRQGDLAHSEEWDRVADAVDEVRRRYGTHSVEPARLLDTDRGKNRTDR